jgi:uncharacterized protein (TIRG00374 family)
MSRVTAKHAFVVLKLVITGAFLYWVFSHLDTASMWRAVRQMHPLVLICAVALNALSFVFGGVRWWMLLRYFVPDISFGRVFPSYYLGIFLNNILPTGVGGDVARTVHLGFHGLRLRSLIASTVMDRAIGFIVVILVGVICALYSPDIELDRDARGYLFLSLLLLVLVIALFLSRIPGRAMQILKARFASNKIMTAVLEVCHACESYRSNIRGLIVAAANSFVVQAMTILAYYVLSRGLGLDMSLFTYFAIVPIVLLATVLPISLGGLGVREGTLIGLLLALGVERQSAITLSLLFLVVLWTSSLPGAFVLFKKISRFEGTGPQRAAG